MKPFFKFSQVVFLLLSTRQLQPSAFYFTQNVLSLKKKKSSHRVSAHPRAQMRQINSTLIKTSISFVIILQTESSGFLQSVLFITIHRFNFK